jgi:epoxyqueuosine reductase
MSPTQRASPLRQTIEEAARALGFSGMGVARAGPSPGAAHLLDWLDAGQHAGLDYMARTAADRLDARALCRGRARSIVLLTTDYPAKAPPRPKGLRGRVSRYASGRDYHRVIERRLRKLRRAVLSAEPRAWVYTSVDTGPVMEKAWAQAAGVGWVGKHGNLLTRTRSSAVLLATLATDLELPPDAPHPEHCGSCDLCVRACPTQAIVRDGVVDANLCIAYHNIEHRDVVPSELRARFGDWVFGCDECQDVCPWNRFADGPHDPALAPREEQAYPDLVELLALDDASCRARFEGTPLARAGRDGLARSAALALGNQRDPAAIPALSRALRSDRHAAVRRHAAWALGRIGGPIARAVLSEALVDERDGEVASELREALRAIERSVEVG